ncbi:MULTISPECIES: hypothetical protein [Halorussus]|uniref:hypothetical protein n=1 Tax=Halorussus TaxID=1070314 RepID=UPI00209E4377|nr:hypothetical protein [Halorussus vallis]USZ77042.1 hypothetical protein NGM07_06870 [Halorussus vallis]
MKAAALTLLGAVAVALVVFSAPVAADAGGPPLVPSQNATVNETPDEDPSVDETVGERPSTPETPPTERRAPTESTPSDDAPSDGDDSNDAGEPDAIQDGTTTATSNGESDVAPGQQLAGAVGAQGAAVQGELWNRTLSERLASASTPDERAQVLADEVETIREYVDALESVRENLTSAWERDRISEGEFRASLSTFVVRARTVERRANRTAAAVAELPRDVRSEYGLSVAEVRNLSVRAHQLYQFEDETAQQVVEETLRNRSRLAEAAPGSERNAGP